jgi:hypothetical protein
MLSTLRSRLSRRMQGRPVVAWVLAGAVAALSVWMAAGIVAAAEAGSARAGQLRRISGASPLPVSCAGSVTPIRDSELEPTLAVDPRRPRRLVAAWQQDRFGDPGAALSNVSAYSSDGGRHWRRRLVPGVSSCTGGVFERARFPWLSIGSEGTVYLASAPSSGGRPVPATLVNRSRDGGRSWSRPVYVDRRADPVAFDEKHAVTADRYRPGVAYMSWGRNRPASTPTGPTFAHDLNFARTTSRGRGWSRPKRIYAARPGVWVFDNEVIASGRRRLVCVFSTVDSENGVQPLVGGRIIYRAIRSHDGGRSWSAPSRIAATRLVLLSDRERATTIRAHGMTFSADAGPHGRLYVAWQDVRSSGSSRILLSSSARGRRWSRPRLVSRGAKRPFSPDLAVAAEGTVGVRFYDLRRDRPGDSALTTDSWFRHSRDRGRHWREARLGGSFDLRTAPLYLGGRYLGLYQTLVALRGAFATVFARGQPAARLGPTDIFFARIKLSGRRESGTNRRR